MIDSRGPKVGGTGFIGLQNAGISAHQTAVMIIVHNASQAIAKGFAATSTDDRDRFNLHPNVSLPLLCSRAKPEARGLPKGRE